MDTLLIVIGIAFLFLNIYEVMRDLDTKENKTKQEIDYSYEVNPYRSLFEEEKEVKQIEPDCDKCEYVYHKKSRTGQRINDFRIKIKECESYRLRARINSSYENTLASSVTESFNPPPNKD